MKRIPITPALAAEIKSVVGEDVDVEGFAVFEAIAINDLPLPGKRGTIFEQARVSGLTLSLMARDVQSGNHLPLMHDHNLHDHPMGRVFRAELTTGEDGSMELRSLFYVDATNAEIADKIDAGSIDEVSVQFLAEKLLCSECGFDYRGVDADWRNITTRMCADGHEIGTDGVHLRLVGLEAFTELSVVSRGAGNKPKIVGKSASKLTAPLMALAARGFEIDELYLTASTGELEVDLSVVLSKLEEQTTAAATAKVELSAATTARDTALADVASRDTRIAELETELADATAANPDAETLTAAQAEVTEAKGTLTEIYTRLAVATDNKAEVPETIAELKTGIEEMQSKLTAAIPAGGAAANDVTNKQGVGSKFNADKASSFKTPR